VSLKGLTLDDLEMYTQAINDKPRRIHNYQSSKKLFELAQTV
ncbi:IS30 family transposase, partial [Streptococcus halotolerans]